MTQEPLQQSSSSSSSKKDKDISDLKSDVKTLSDEVKTLQAELRKKNVVSSPPPQPNHEPNERRKVTSKVYDKNNEYKVCGSAW